MYRVKPVFVSCPSQPCHSGNLQIRAIPLAAKVNLSIMYTPPQSPDMHYVKHKLVKSTLPSHHVKHDDTRLPPNSRRAEKQAVSRHPGLLDLNLKRVLSVEFVELSP
jgi:hypothetical protein